MAGSEVSNEPARSESRNLKPHPVYCQRDNKILHLVIFFMFFEGWKLFTLLEKKYKC